MKMQSTLVLLFISSLAAAGCVTPSQQDAGSKAKAVPGYIDGKPVRALYVPLRRGTRANNLAYLERLIAEAKPLGVNSLALDAQVYNGRTLRLKQESVDYVKSQGLEVVIRVVCFQGGITRLPVPEKRMHQLKTLVDEVGQMGVDEIQLDYIRFADSGLRYGLTRKHEFITNIVRELRAISSKHNTRLSADIFGRIVYNRKDGIGQNLELFAEHTDVIYPMLYPSHFTGDKKRLSDPHFTMTEGTTKAITRLKEAGSKTQIMPFIQVFVYNIQHARVPLWKYVQLQIDAVENTEARGWMAWNARGDYAPLFRALNEIENSPAETEPTAAR